MTTFNSTQKVELKRTPRLGLTGDIHFHVFKDFIQKYSVSLVLEYQSYN